MEVNKTSGLLIGPPRMRKIVDIDAITPTFRVGDCWVKRDDFFYANGGRGGKCRAAVKLTEGSSGVVTYGSRTSPQGAYTVCAAASVGVQCVYVCPHGLVTPEMAYVAERGGEVVQIVPGYLSQCRSVANQIAKVREFTMIPLSMESETAVQSTRQQVPGSIPDDVQRVVVVVGGGISAAGISWGLQDIGRQVPVVGVQIGRDPRKQLIRWCPFGRANEIEVVQARDGYHRRAPNVWRDVVVDPYYEAKCLPFIQPGDLFWIVGIRPVLDGIVID